MKDYMLIQVQHPQYTTDEMLADWLGQLEVRSDTLCDLLRWSVLGSTALPQAPDMTLTFLPSGQVEVNITGRINRVISFLNAQTDDERMQQLLDILINCWAEQGIIGLDLTDVFAVMEASEHGLIVCVEDVKTLPDFVARWPNEVAPLLGSGQITSLQCIYREYQPTQDDFSRYAFAVESLAEEDGVVVIGIMPTARPEDRQNAVLYLGVE